MGKKESYEDEEMTVELELEDGTVVNCAIITILTVEAKDYIVPSAWKVMVNCEKASGTSLLQNSW